MIRKLATLAVATAMIAVASAANAQSHTSKTFAGAKVNKGTVTHTMTNGQHVLTLSPDFQVPDTPDPHWQVVDSTGRVFLLQRLNIKNGVLGLAGDKLNRSITVPAYISDVAKVQIYCSWAEAVLGETTFDQTVMTATTSK
jgi:hypothetical protein